MLVGKYRRQPVCSGIVTSMFAFLILLKLLEDIKIMQSLICTASKTVNTKTSTSKRINDLWSQEVANNDYNTNRQRTFTSIRSSSSTHHQMLVK